MTTLKEPGLGEALKKIEQLYSTNIKQYGTCSKSVGWRDWHSHRLRFQKLVQVVDSTNNTRGITVNDYGCGYGAMFIFLVNESGIRIKSYHGYDISSDMLKQASQLIRDRRAHFVLGNKITRVADYSFVSGTFNVRFCASNYRWKNFIIRTINDMARKSTKGFAFNLLSTYVDWKAEHLYYGDPLYFFDYCKRNISRYVVLVHDYPLYEWTILVKMGRSAK